MDTFLSDRDDRPRGRAPGLDMDATFRATGCTSDLEAVEPHFDEPRTEELSPSDRLLLLSQIEQLETGLGDARKEANGLRAAKERLERDLQSAKTAQTHNCPNPLFRRVGLDEGAPEWLVVAVRRAYRKRLHPDAHPEGRKPEAERRFKEAEQIFDEIWRVKGFQSR